MCIIFIYLHSNEESDDTNSPDSGFNKNQSLPPLSVNSHLHHMSNLQLNMDCGTQTLKLQKWVSPICYHRVFSMKIKS
jgi:hypothetical protein